MYIGKVAKHLVQTSRCNSASPSLASARHIREVVRKQHGKHESISASETLHATCGVLRTTEYIRAMEIMTENDCSPEDFEEALKVVEDPESYPWKLADRMSEIHKDFVSRMNEAEDKLLPFGKLLCGRDPALGFERLLDYGEMGVMKSIQGTGSIPGRHHWL